MHTKFLFRRCVGGSALAATMMVVAALVAFLSISALITSVFGRFSSRQQGSADLMAAADAGMEYIYAQWTAAKRNNNAAPAPAVGDLNSTALPYNAAGITFSVPSGYQLISFADQNGSVVSSAVGVPTSNVPGYPGWSGTTFNSLASLTVTNAASQLHYGFSLDANGRGPSLTVHRVFQYTQVPLFQAAIFYENKLEIHPGAAMAVSGLVHSNGDIWARGFSTLQFKSNVSYVGSYNEVGDSTITKGWDGNGGGYIPGVGAFASVPMVTWSDGKLTGSSTSRKDQLNPVNPIDPFGGASTNNNGLHDMVEVPPTGNTDTARAYNNAAVVVVIDSSKATGAAGRLTITDNRGNTLSPADTTAITNAVNGGGTTTIYDQREGQNVVTTTLDMTKLAAATVSSTGAGTGTTLQRTFWPSGTATPSGTIYIHDVSKTSGSEPAIRLVNGRDLKQNVTVATDNGVYIQGDYNTGGTKAADVPSNVNNPTGAATPVALGYSRYSSAVMADAVTILSNSWSDSNSSLALAKRVATPTTVNTAILAGDVTSNLNGNKTASGGAHNFPRFLESWDGVNFTYWGSLVEAYHSEEFTGLWQTGNVYYWPNRMWNFDINFINNPPPGTARGIQFSRGRWQRD